MTSPSLRRAREAPTSLPGGVSELLTMLTYKRPHGSEHERMFIERFILPTGAEPDEYGNLWLTIGEGCPILWSSHTDTVHRGSGLQRIEYGDGYATAPDSDCLGADCTTGVWIMVNMIRARVPGTYVFHRAEEVGGMGSAYVACHAPDRLAGFQFAIAFDRKGIDEVITRQIGDTASDAFAFSLARALAPLHYVPSADGIFTDTANYAEVIPECSNISVGYYRAHSSSEHQDVGHAVALLAALIAADWDGLVCNRVPTKYDAFEDPIFGYDWGLNEPLVHARDIYQFTYANPTVVAEFLETHGFTLSDLELFRR